ncbi:hypothetical protein Tco_0140697 [Tanacetum coccineum]
MSSDEFYKFCDGTLTSVRIVLHDIASNLRMEYFPKRRCSERDMIRSRIMIKKIDKRLYKRRLMRNLVEILWWQRIWGRPQATGMNNMTLSCFVLCHFRSFSRI